MSRIQILHHVYSSVQGYETLKASPGIPNSSVEVLEEFSDKIYPRAKRTARFSLFPPDDIFLCCSMSVLSGVDHVGRQRAVVHNVLMRREEVAGLDGFNHFKLPPGIFLKTGGDLQRDIKALPQHLDWETPADSPAGLRFDKETLPRKAVLNLLRVMLSGRTAVVRSDKDQAWERLTLVSGLLPSAVRETLAVINGAFIPELAAYGTPSIFLVGSDFDPSELVRNGSAVLEDGGLSGVNVPDPGPWDRYVVGLVTAGDPHGDLDALLKAVNHYRPLSRYAPQALEDLVGAFQAARACFMQDGRVNCKKAPADALRAAAKFFLAGHSDIAFEIFLECLRLLGSRELWEPVHEFGRAIASGAGILSPFFAEGGESVADLADFEDDEESEF